MSYSTEWLRQYLEEHGPSPVKELDGAAFQAGIQPGALRYAKDTAKVRYDFVRKYQGGRLIRLPHQRPLPNTRPAEEPSRNARMRRNPHSEKVSHPSPILSIRRRKDAPPSHREEYRVQPDPLNKILHVFLDADWQIRIYENLD